MEIVLSDKGFFFIWRKAYEVDRAGEVVLEYLPLLPEHDLCLMRNRNMREIMVISTWCWWWQRRKLVRKESAQNVHQICTRARALTANFVTTSSPKVSMN